MCGQEEKRSGHHGKSDEEMDSIELHGEGEKALTSTEEERQVLDIRYQRLAHAERRIIKWMAQKGVGRDKDMCRLSISKDFSAHIQGTMTNTQMKPRRHVKLRSSAVFRTDVAEMNERSLDGAKYLVTYIDESFGFFRAIHMKSNGEVAELLKEHVMCVQRQTKSSITKTEVDGGKEYVKGLYDLKAREIEISVTEKYTPQENWNAKRMNRTIKILIQTLLFRSRTPTNLWAECVYTVCDAHHHIGRPQ